jgi:tRNA G18 (ribose-2'-O)-methylase SpoU
MKAGFMDHRRKQLLAAYEKERARNALAKPGPHTFTLVLDHLKASFNIPKIFRSAEAFGAAGVHLVGIQPFDPGPAKGSIRKVPAHFHDEVNTAFDQLRQQDYTLIALDPAAEDVLGDTALPERTAFLLGHEEFGFSFNPADYPGIRAVKIRQFGQIQSLNVSIAASIAMYEYTRQWTAKKGITPTPPKPTSDRHASGTRDKVFGR